MYERDRIMGMDPKQEEIDALVRAATDEPPFPFVLISEQGTIHKGIEKSPIWGAEYDIVCRLNTADPGFDPCPDDDETWDEDKASLLTYCLHIVQLKSSSELNSGVYFIYQNQADVDCMSETTAMAGTFASLAGVGRFLASYVEDWSAWSYAFSEEPEQKREIVEMLEQLPTSTGEPIQYDEYMGLLPRA